MSYPNLFYHFLSSYPIKSSSILFYPILYFLFLCDPIRTYHILLYPVLGCSIIPSLIPSSPILSHIVLFYDIIYDPTALDRRLFYPVIACESHTGGCLHQTRPGISQKVSPSPAPSFGFCARDRSVNQAPHFQLSSFSEFPTLDGMICQPEFRPRISPASPQRQTTFYVSSANRVSSIAGHTRRDKRGGINAERYTRRGTLGGIHAEIYTQEIHGKAYTRRDTRGEIREESGSSPLMKTV